MKEVPAWPNLKHFESITTMEFSDGQGYLDALKVSCTLGQSNNIPYNYSHGN